MWRASSTCWVARKVASDRERQPLRVLPAAVRRLGVVEMNVVDHVWTRGWRGTPAHMFPSRRFRLLSAALLGALILPAAAAAQEPGRGSPNLSYVQNIPYAQRF